MAQRILTAKPIVPGRAEGPALVSRQPLCLWGGLNPQTGEIIDPRHDRAGEIATNKIFIFPHGRGSSTASAILADAIRNQTAPAAIINLKTDPILALGSIVSDELYRQMIPIFLLPEDAFYSIKDEDYLIIESDGTLRIPPPPSPE